MIVYKKIESQDSSFLYSFTSCHTIEEKELEGLGDMSFAGMVVYHDGIVAFADSKATRISLMGNMFQDKEKESITKLFFHNDYILATTGNNEIFLNKEKHYIDEYLQKKIKSNLSWQNILSKLYFTILENDYPDDYAIQFLIGNKNLHPINYADNYQVQHFQISKNGLTRHFQTRGQYQSPPVITIGNKYYTGMTKYIQTGNSTKDFHQTLNSVERIIKEADSLFNEYNPVGLPLTTYVFR